MKKPKFAEKIKTEAVVASVVLVFLIGFGLFFVSGNGDNNDAFALTGTQAADPNSAQPANETGESGELVYYTIESGGYWYLVEIPGTLMTYVPVEYRTSFVSELSDTVVNAPDNSQTTETGSIQIIEGDNGDITLLDDDGNDIDWDSLPEDVKEDLMRLFPELFDNIDDPISDDNETAENDTEEDPFDYPEAEEEDLNLSDIEYGDDDGFADDFDDEQVPDENETEDQTQDDTQNQTQNDTDEQNETGTIDTGNDDVGQVEEVNPLDDEEEFPEDVPDDLPDDDWINDWING